MTLFLLTPVTQNVAGRQCVVKSDICWIFEFLGGYSIDTYNLGSSTKNYFSLQHGSSHQLSPSSGEPGLNTLHRRRLSMAASISEGKLEFFQFASSRIPVLI